MSTGRNKKKLSDFDAKNSLVPTLHFNGQGQKENDEHEIKFYPNRVFVNNLDCYHGKHIAHLLSEKIFHDQPKADESEGEMGEGEEDLMEESPRTMEIMNDFPSLKHTYDIVGTLKNKFARPSEEIVTAVLNEENQDVLVQEIFKCGFIIYDITDDPNEIPKALAVLGAIEKLLDEIKEKTPKKYKSMDQRIFVLISTVMTWAKTRPIDPEDPDVPFVETDFRKRKPHPNYKPHCDLEKAVIATGKRVKDKLLTIVIASGITYGEEEEDLHFLFKLAYFNKFDLPLSLPGNNIIPLINVKDLVSILYAIFEKPPKKPKYILAVEQSTCTQKQIVTSLSKALGNDRMRYMSKEEMFLFPDVTQKIHERINVHLKMDPGCIVNEFEIPWQSDLNFCENINKIVKEYKESRGLRPINIMIHGPVGVGKTMLSRKLAEYYNLPYIGLKNMVTDIIAQLQSDIEYSKEMLRIKAEKEKAKENEMEEEDVEEEEDEDDEDHEAKIEDWKKKLVEIEKALESSTTGKLPAHLYTQLVKEKLQSNLCQNHGYILDGYPEFIEEAKNLFDVVNDDAPMGEEEEDDIEEEGEEPRKTIMPHYIISLQAADDFLFNRIMHLPEKELNRLYKTEELYVQSLTKFRDENLPDAPNILDMFDEREIHPYLINAETDDFDTIFSLAKAKIGEVKMYPLTPQEEEEKRLIEEEAYRKQLEEERLAREELERKAEEERNQNMEKWADLLQALQQEEQELIGAKCENLREYLVKYIFPTLTKGLLETARVKPSDPIDFLAEFLFKENPEGRMFDPAYVANADDMFKIIEDYQDRLGV